MRNRTGRLILFLCAALAAMIPCCALAELEGVAAPVRLHFVNAIDTNAYTERLVYEVFRRMGIDVTFTLEDMSIALRGVNADVYDGICNQTTGVANGFDQLIAVPMETAVGRFYAITPQDDPFAYNTWADLRGRRVGSLEGNPFIIDALPKDVVSHIEATCMSRLYDSLRSGECDVAIIADTSGKDAEQLVVPSGLRVAGTVDTHSCSIFLNRKHAALVDQIVEVLEGMEQDGSLARIKAMKPARDVDDKIVLYLSSYSSEMQWEQHLLQGISDVLNREKNVRFYNISLNSFRNTNVEMRENAALKAISEDFIHVSPDAVIVSDNEAMNFLINNYNAILPNDIPVIACGINNIKVMSPHWFDRYPNMVGIVESICAVRTVETMLALFPSTEEIFVINDASLTGRRWREEMQTQLQPFADRVEIRYNENVSFDQLMAQVSALDDNSLVLCGSYFLDRNDRYYPQAAVQESLYQASSVPIFGLLDDSQSYGQLGGEYTSGELHGQIAANYLVEAMRSGSTEQITYIDTEDDNKWVFNWDIMQRYGIRKSQLPSDATVLNAPLSLREENPVLFYSIIVAAVGCAVIIMLMAIFSFAQKRRNGKLVLAEADIRKSRDETVDVKNHLQTILETAPIAYSLLVDDIVVESNSFYKANIGVAEGRKNAEKYDESSRYTQLMDECRAKGFVGNIYWHTTKANGERERYLYNIALSEYAGKQAIVMWGVSIEQIERQKDTLNRAYLDLQALMKSSPSPIAMIYPTERRFLNTNPAWRALFGVPDSFDITSVSWGDEGILTSRPMDDLIEQAMETGNTMTEWEFRTYDGVAFDAKIYLNRMVFDGKECLLVTLQDMRAERARERMLKNAAEKEREANRLKSHFLMNMSHEIRTPMNAIIGITQLAKPTDEAEKLYGSIQQIGHSTAVLLNIVNDVLDLSLLEDGKMVLKPEVAKLSQIIDDLDAIVAVEAGKKHIGRALHLEEIVHDAILVDASRLEQAIIVLASNAIKFTADGGRISLTISESVDPDGKMSTFQFAVRDNGAGIEPDKMSRLFKPFEQGDDSVTRQYGGAGLGLSIAKSIVELMGGTIWVESEEGKGSCFFFTIRVPVVAEPERARAQSGETGSSCEEGAGKGTIDFSGLRVLLVDDVEINRMVAAELLNELGITSEQAENGRQAVDMVAQSAPGYYDLVFMDVQMPILDGCSATKEIRALDRPDVAALPIVAMTANVMPDDIKMVLEAGMNGYVGKPIFLEQLVETIGANIMGGKK